jgi:hypothetical protein
VFLDVDDAGALLLQLPDATISRFVAGDLVRGPRPLLQGGEILVPSP